MLALSESPLTFGCFVFFVLFVSFVLIYLCRFAFSLFRPFAFSNSRKSLSRLGAARPAEDLPGRGANFPPDEWANVRAPLRRR